MEHPLNIYQHAYEKEGAIHTPARAACRYVRMWPHGLW